MSPRIAVVDYGIGNLRSAQKALERVGARARLTDSMADLEAADAVVLPGVGAFGACMEALQRSGLADATRAAAVSGRPFLGICVGMQMLCACSEESPGVPGLGVFGTEVVRMEASPLPQMQWNPIDVVRPHPVLDGRSGHWMYFVHSFAAADGPDEVARCDYGGPVTAALARDRVLAVQFHPEKSGAQGLALLGAFVEWAAGA